MSIRTLSQRKLSGQRYNSTNTVLLKGSVFLDGSGDFLSLPANAAFTLGTGSYTVEAWVRFTSLSAIVGIFSTTAVFGTTGNLRLQMGGGAGNNQPTLANAAGALLNGTALSTDTWVHIAVVRNGSTVTLYQNGTSVGSITDAGSYASDTFQIGSFSSSFFFPGYISNFRLLKGVAAYTGSFTPATSALAAISGTSLLTCQSPTTITDASGNGFLVVPNGNAVASSLSPFA